MTKPSDNTPTARPSRQRATLAAAAAVASAALLSGCAMPDIWLPWNATESAIDDADSPEVRAGAQISDLSTLEEVMAAPGGYIDAAFIGDTNVIVALTSGPSVLHLDPETLETTQEILLPEGMSFSTESAIGLQGSGKYLSPDGTHMVMSPFLDEQNGNFTASGPCLILSTSDGSVLAEIPTDYSCNFAYSEDQTYFFHSMAYQSQIAMYDATTFALLETFDTREYPTHLVATRDHVGHTFLEFEEGFSEGVEFISLDSGVASSQVETEGTPYGLVSAANYPWILVKNLGSSSLLAVSKDTLGSDGTLDIPGFTPGEELASASHGGVFAIATRAGTIASLSLTELSVIDQFSTGVNNLSTIFFSPDGGSLYAFGDQAKIFTRQ